MSLSNRRFQANGFCKLKAIDVVCVLLLVAYFLHFAVPARHAGFREDEMMNLWTYWYLGAARFIICPSTTFSG
jgi:hypothetical protein